MKAYSYVNDKLASRNYQQKSTANRRDSGSLPSLEQVNSHVGLLVAQAIFLMLLALVHIGIEARAVRLEAQARVPVSNIESDQEAFIADSGDSESAVLGADDQDEPSPTPTPFNTLPKEYYSIAITGDSMIDTMGDDVEDLKKALEEKYPGTQFVIYNYGKGARTVTDGLKDFHEPLDHNGRRLRSIDTLQPDIIIVGSFGYNVYNPPDRNQHWLEYTRLVQEAERLTPNVYLLAEIAPLRSGFGIGVDGILWEPQNAWTYTSHIINQIKNVMGLSETLGLPLIDAYTPSLRDDREEGRRELINTSDNIHPSSEGFEFMAEIIANELDFEDVR